MIPLSGTRNWLQVLRRYLLFIAVGNLAWEFAHMPLYTIWETGTTEQIILYGLHCTAGDILIALSALVIALFVFGTPAWPGEGYVRVGIVAVILGIGYTMFSEWLNIEVREAWAYRDIMPVIPLTGAGLTPMLQWIVLPILGLWWARR
jgi:hypothetical protein